MADHAATVAEAICSEAMLALSRRMGKQTAHAVVYGRTHHRRWTSPRPATPCSIRLARLARNEWLTVIRGALAVGRQLPEPPAGAPGPFGLAGADHVRRILGAAGFVDVHLEEVDEPVGFGANVEDAFAFVRTFGITKGLTQDLDEDSRARAFGALRRTIADHETDDGVLFGSAAWLVTARVPRRST